MTTHEKDIEVLGVPVTARYSFTPEDPSVGVFREVEDCILHSRLTGLRFRDLERRVTDDDWRKIDTELLEGTDA